MRVVVVQTGRLEEADLSLLISVPVKVIDAAGVSPEAAAAEEDRRSKKGESDDAYFLPEFPHASSLLCLW